MADRFYGDDLAAIHHEGFAAHAAHAAPFLLRRLRAAGLRGGLVVDLGCGSGTWLHALTEAGYDAIGVDRSAAMIALARRTAPDAALVRASLHDVELPPCDGITALGEALTYAGDDGRPPALAPILRRAACALRPGGLFAFDAVVAAAPAMHYTASTVGRDWCVAVSVRERRGAVERAITTFRRTGRDRWRRRDETHVVRVLDERTTLAALGRAGFSVEMVRAFGRHPLPPRRALFLATRTR